MIVNSLANLRVKLWSPQRMFDRDQEAAALAAAETEPGLLVQRAEQLMRRGDLATALAVLDTAVTVLTNKQGTRYF